MLQEGATEIGFQIAQQIRQLRLARQWSREELAERAQINVYTLKRFERTGQIALERLLRICEILNLLEDVVRIFKPRQRINVREWSLPIAPTRQRGRKYQRSPMEETVE